MVSPWPTIDLHRRRLGLTLKKLAEKCGVSESAVQKWKNGGGVDIATLNRLAVLFSLPLVDLIHSTKVGVGEDHAEYPSRQLPLSDNRDAPYSKDAVLDRIESLEISQKALVKEIHDCSVQLNTLTRLLGASLRRDPERGAAPPGTDKAPSDEPLANGA